MLWNHDEKFIRMAGLGVPLLGRGGLVSQAALSEDAMMEAGNGVRTGVCTSWLGGEEYSGQKKGKAGAQQGSGGQCGPMKAVEAKLVGFPKSQRIEYGFYFK